MLKMDTVPVQNNVKEDIKFETKLIRTTKHFHVI